MDENEETVKRSVITQINVTVSLGEPVGGSGFSFHSITPFLPLAHARIREWTYELMNKRLTACLVTLTGRAAGASAFIDPSLAPHKPLQPLCIDPGVGLSESSASADRELSV